MSPVSIRSLTLTLALALVGACTAQASTTTTARLDAIEMLTGTSTSGATAYSGQCASCHGASGQGGAGPTLVGADETAVIQALLAAPGGMPAFSALTDQQIADIAAFVVAM